MSRSLRAAVFVDRDGTLIHDTGYPADPADVSLFPGAAEALRMLRSNGYAIVLVSNQSGLARELITPDQARRVHERLESILSQAAVPLDGSYYCPHGPDEGCGCRKPAPGLILRAAAELGFDLEQSVMIGDKVSDVEAGRRAGCRTILFAAESATASAEARCDAVASSWPEVTRTILLGSWGNECRG